MALNRRHTGRPGGVPGEQDDQERGQRERGDDRSYRHLLRPGQTPSAGIAPAVAQQHRRALLGRISRVAGPPWRVLAATGLVQQGRHAVGGVVVVRIAHRMAPCPPVRDARRLPAVREQRKLAFQRHASVAELTLQLCGLVLQVGDAPAAVMSECGLRSHFRVPSSWPGPGHVRPW